MKRFAILALIMAGVFWGLGFPLGKLILTETEAAHMVLLRFAVAAAASLPFALKSRESRALFRSPAVLGAGARREGAVKGNRRAEPEEERPRSSE